VAAAVSAARYRSPRSVAETVVVVVDSAEEEDRTAAVSTSAAVVVAVAFEQPTRCSQNIARVAVGALRRIRYCFVVVVVVVVVPRRRRRRRKKNWSNCPSSHPRNSYTHRYYSPHSRPPSKRCYSQNCP